MNHEYPMQAPWYRHRWPWLLMAGPLTVVVAGIVTAWLAASGNALVADDYYKQGLTINRVLERERRAEELGVRLSIEAARQGEGTTQVDIALSMNDAAARPPRLRVLLAHPTRSELDRELLLTGEGGRYRGALLDLAPTHWNIVVEDDARTWRLQEHLVIGAAGALGEDGGRHDR